MSFLLPALVGSLGLYLAYCIYFRIGLIRLKPRGGKPSAFLPTVSVIVAARNEEKHLPKLLADLAGQDYPTKQLEIIIADDRSTDDTWMFIKDYMNRFPFFSGVRITERSESMTSKKNALTKAIDLSRGEIILSTDADCRVPKTWVSSMVNTFDKDTGIVVGYSGVDQSAGTLFVQYQALDFLALMAANAGALGWNNAWTGSAQNLAYRRFRFREINGFVPVADQTSGDDMYLVQAISKRSDVKFNASTEGFVKTAPVWSLRQFLNQRIRWSSNSRKLVGIKWAFLTFLFTTLVLNVVLLTGLFTPGIWFILPTVFILKFIADALVVFTGSKKFNTPIVPQVFICWSILQPVYIPLVGLLGLAGKFRWKR